MKKQKKDSQTDSQAVNGADAVEAQAGTPDAAPQAADAPVDGADDATQSQTEPEGAATVPADVAAALETELAETKAAVAAQTEQLQRLAAEFQNSKRRQEKQLADAIDRAGSHIIQQLLPVIDDFDLAFNNLPAELTAEESGWVDGFRQIQKKLVNVLTDQGLTPMAAEGVFDPNLHEAITSEPHDEIESGHIIQTLRTGYEYKGRVLRPAMVRVAS